MTDLSPLVPRLKAEEGLRLQVYDDATGAMIRPGSRVAGNPTIGVGTNLGPGAGITEAEAEYLLMNRLRAAATDAATLSGFNSLDDVRRLVLVDMAFNMGAPGVRKFAGMLTAIQAHNYAGAAAAMLDSLWAKQVGQRASALAEIMRTGSLVMTWLLTLWSKIKLWALALAGVLAAIGSAWLYGRHRGKEAQQQADATRDAQANAQAAKRVAQAQEARNEVEAEVSQLPPAPAQQVAQADPATATGKLRDDGWTRD